MAINEIYLVSSWEQWVLLRDAGLLVPDGSGAIAACDLDAVVDAGDHGIPVLDLFSHQSFAQAKCHEEMAWAFCDQIAEVLKGRLVYQGCDLLDRIKLDFAFPLMYALNAAFMVGQCLREHPQARLRIFPQRQKAFVWLPGEQPPDLFNAAAWWQAERMGFRPEPVEGPPPPPAEPSSYNWKVANSSLVSTGKRRTSGEASAASPEAGGTACGVLSVGEFLNMAEQECALAFVAKEKRADWFVASSDPLDVLPRFDSIHLWRLPPATAELERELAVFQERHLPLVRAHLGTGYDVVLDNPHMDFFWNHMAGLLRSGASRYAAGRLLAEGLRPKVVVMGSDHLGTTRCLARAFDDAGSACVSIQHDGMLSPFCVWPMYKDNPNHLVLWSDEMIPYLRPLRPAGSILRVTGSFRSDMRELRRFKPPDPVNGRRPKIVLFSTRLGNMILARSSSFRHHQVWREVVRLCERHPEWDFVVKSHPRFRYQALHSSRACRHIPNLTAVQGKPLDVLAGASAAVLLTELSTVALDAIAAGVPVLWLKAAVVAPDRPGEKQGGVLEVQTVGELEDMLLRLLADEAFRSHAKADGREFLERSLPFTGDEAAARLCEFADELAAKSILAQPPDPTARWLIDLMDLLARTQAGQGTMEGFWRRLAALRKRGRKIDVRRLDYFDAAKLREYVLEVAVLRPWRRGDVDLPRLALRICRGFPRALRPPLSVLRAVLVQAYVKQGKRTPGWRCKFLPYILAPGRLWAWMHRARPCAADSPELTNSAMRGGGRMNQD